MKFRIKLFFVLLFLGVIIGIYFNLPQETIQFIELPPIKLPPIVQP